MSNNNSKDYETSNIQIIRERERERREREREMKGRREDLRSSVKKKT